MTPEIEALVMVGYFLALVGGIGLLAYLLDRLFTWQPAFIFVLMGIAWLGVVYLVAYRLILVRSNEWLTPLY